MKSPLTSQGIPLDKEKIYQSLFDFMDDVLFQYISSTGIKAEDDITQELVNFLEIAARDCDSSFLFLNQYKDGSFKADMGVFIINSRKPFCLVEAKRLPTPNEKHRDEREYVIVSSEKKEDGTRKFDGGGGIQRFKEGKYANTLQYSIMLGYMQDSNKADYWQSKINTWITELFDTGDGFWTIDDCLSKYVSKKCNRFLSSHKRKDGTKILLHHYWIKIITLL